MGGGPVEGTASGTTGGGTTESVGGGRTSSGTSGTEADGTSGAGGLGAISGTVGGGAVGRDVEVAGRRLAVDGAEEITSGVGIGTGDITRRRTVRQ